MKRTLAASDRDVDGVLHGRISESDSIDRRYQKVELGMTIGPDCCMLLLAIVYTYRIHAVSFSGKSRLEVANSPYNFSTVTLP